MERKKASEFDQELLNLFTNMCMGRSAAVISWTARRNLPSAA